MQVLKTTDKISECLFMQVTDLFKMSNIRLRQAGSILEVKRSVRLFSGRHLKPSKNYTKKPPQNV